MKNTNPKVLFLFPAAYSLGGLAVWLGYLVPALRQRGWDATLGLLTGKFHDAEQYTNKYAVENVYLVGNPCGTREGRVSAIFDAAVSTGADLLVSVNVPDVFEAANRYKLKANNQAKAVMTIHGLESDLFKDLVAMNSQIDAVVTTNQLTRSMVIDYANFDTGRTFYAPYGVEAVSDAPNQNILTKPRILYAGRLEQPQKQCADLVNLVRKMEANNFDYELIIAGDGPDRDILVSDFANESKLGTVRFMGELQNRQLLEEVLPNADILILTSLWETGPIVIWEAMAVETAVVSSRYVGSKLEGALVDQKNCLLFDIGDIDQAFSNIQALSEPILRNSIIQGGSALIAQRYSREVSVAQWSETLQTIVEEVSSKESRSLIGTWSVSGRLEKWFGYRFASMMRRILKKPALALNAGDEWPHSYSMPTNQEYHQFENTLLHKESQADVNSTGLGD